MIHEEGAHIYGKNVHNQTSSLNTHFRNLNELQIYDHKWKKKITPSVFPYIILNG